MPHIKCKAAEERQSIGTLLPLKWEHQPIADQIIIFLLEASQPRNTSKQNEQWSNDSMYPQQLLFSNLR